MVSITKIRSEKNTEPAYVKNENITYCHMAGGRFSGLTSQTSIATSYRSDRISLGNPAQPHTSDRYVSF